MGRMPRVTTLLELDEMIEKGDDRVKNAMGRSSSSVWDHGMTNSHYCSRVCCSHSVKNALRSRNSNPEMDVYVLYRDMRTYGFKEDYYKKASDQGVIFIRYQPEDPPDIQAVEEEGQVRS